MAIRIIEISPKIIPQPSDVIFAHLSIKNFKWANEETSQEGISSREILFDWIVNKKGQAYIRLESDLNAKIPVFGAVSPTGQRYIRCLKNNQWSNELLELPQI